MFNRLNPCCNGRGSKTRETNGLLILLVCLNPCCNGRGSKTFGSDCTEDERKEVLILVVMEEGQRPFGISGSSKQ